MDLPIYFYIPAQFWPAQLPSSPDENWPGFGLGMYTWTIQTYLRLRAIAFPCQLVSELPARGVILVDHNHLRAMRFKPERPQFIVCLKQDGLPYPYAQYHIVQNPCDAAANLRYHYMPHWPQPGLVERHPERGDRFENVAFFGHSINLAPALQTPAWQHALMDMGLKWCAIANRNHWRDYHSLDHRWNDYGDVDVIVAVRSFGTRNPFHHKPATKLYNAWLAGVPAILGYESAFRSEGQPGVNYLEATTPDAVLQALATLRDNVALRHQVVNQGCQAAQNFTADQTVQRWQHFLANVALPAFEVWCRCPRSWQLATLHSNWLRYKVGRGIVRVQNRFAMH